MQRGKQREVKCFIYLYNFNDDNNDEDLYSAFPKD